MYSERENFIRTINNNNPDRLCVDYEALAGVRNDPVSMLDRGNRMMGQNTVDIWGTEIIWPQGQPGGMPHVTEQNKVLKDVCEWKKQVKFPDYASMDLDWSECQKSYSEVNREEKLLTLIMGTGLFERLHFLMGFEDTLVNFLTEPEAMHELLDAILEVRLTFIKLIIKNMKPDVIIHHDDLGSKNSLFFSKKIWEEFFKERYRKIYSLIRENGIIAIHHADSYCANIVSDMAEIGIQAWQGAIPENDIPAMQKELNGKMVIMGGVNAIVDHEGWTEEEVRKEARRACNESGPLGSFIPCLTYGGPGSIYPGVLDIIKDEIRQYNKETYKI